MEIDKNAIKAEHLGIFWIQYFMKKTKVTIMKILFVLPEIQLIER
ncbi:MAG TPA: hypothetical protein VK250_07960 [Nitrososphaeraceae archaeon]|nr:hypothetical protein [Nitrososphaeraceae archaeon]